MAVSREHIYREFLRSDGISTDSRGELHNRIFVALEGENFDGNRFVEQALEKGCRLALTSRKELEGERRIAVVDPLTMLQELATHHRRQLSVKVLAITGSNGKTTSKEMIASILGGKYRTGATRGNLNNHIGVPLTLLSFKEEEEIVIVEMGANHPGEIALLSSIAEPDFGIITNVGKAHLEGFGSLEGVLEAKGELYDYLAENGGVAIVDGEDRLLVDKARKAGVKTLLVGRQDSLDVTGTLHSQDPFLEVDLTLGGHLYTLKTKIVGRYNLQNIRLAAATGLYFGVPGESIISALASYTPVNHRSQLVAGNKNRLIMDAYNANPTSMRLAVESLLDYARRPLMLILGDMAELGPEAEKEHRDLVAWLAELKPGRILLAGDQFSKVAGPFTGDDLRAFRNTESLGEYLDQEKPAGYTILLKGSRIMRLENLIRLLE